MSGPSVAGQCNKCGGWVMQCNCAALSPVRSESLLVFCRMCKVWDDVCKECLKDECPVEKLPIAAQRLLDAWDMKTPLAWQPENNRALLEDLREALHTDSKPTERTA